MKDWNMGYALLPMSLSASFLLAGGLYHKTGKCRRLKADCRRLYRQNEYLRKYRRELEGQHRQLRAIRHEMANEYILEMEYLERGLYRQLEEHYREKAGYFYPPKNVVDTGNVGMDAILTSKLGEAKREQIEVDFEHQAIGQVRIDDSDLSGLLGNLITNAMEAVRHTAERKITLRIRTDGTAFFLEITNPYEGTVKKNERGGYETLKPDRQFHGLGLLQVKRIVRKYRGSVLISDENNCFDVKVLLYMRDDPSRKKRPGPFGDQR